MRRMRGHCACWISLCHRPVESKETEIRRERGWETMPTHCTVRRKACGKSRREAAATLFPAIAPIKNALAVKCGTPLAVSGQSVQPLTFFHALAPRLVLMAAAFLRHRVIRERRLIGDNRLDHFADVRAQQPIDRDAH